MVEIDGTTILGTIVIVLAVIFCAWGIHTTLEYEEDYGVGSVVTTTAEYEYLTNDSFSGVVVCGGGFKDLSCTVRSKDGGEHRIATSLLEPVE